LPAWCPQRMSAAPGYIHRVGVLAEHRGHGLQLRLLRAMEARGGRNGWSCMVSDTTHNIASANNFIRAGCRLYQLSRTHFIGKNRSALIHLLMPPIQKGCNPVAPIGGFEHNRKGLYG